jgi:Pao retrotransposon peptidase
MQTLLRFQNASKKTKIKPKEAYYQKYQSLWVQKLDCDEQISGKHKAEWSQFSSQLKKLKEIKIKR